MRGAPALRGLLPAILAAALALPPVAGAGNLTLRVNDAEAEAGAVASIIVRTYAPRPIGQGQMIVIVRRPGGRPAARAVVGRSESALQAETPFAAFLGGAVMALHNDVTSSFEFGSQVDLQSVFIDFFSPSGSVNQADGPMVRLDFLLREDLLPGEEFEVSVDLGQTTMFDPSGQPHELRMEPGILTIEGPRAGTLEFDQRTYAGTESAGVAVITVERSRGGVGSVAVDYAATAGTATAGVDFEPVSGTFTWADGDETLRSFTVPLVADGVAEPLETVSLSLTNATNGAVLDPVGSNALLSITDSPPPPPPGPTEPPALPPEPPPAAGAIRLLEVAPSVVEAAGATVVRLERFGGADGPVTLAYTTADLSAEAGFDYAAASGTVSWAAGEAGVREIALAILDDEIEEGGEQFSLVLGAPSGGAVLSGATRAEVTILDDDAAITGCTPSASTLCLQNGRFEITAVWRTAERGGFGHPRLLTESSGLFWFFSEDNAEVLIKVLDACARTDLPGYWVYYAATTDVGLTLTVTDRETGLSREYTNVLGNLADPVTDTGTFRSCPAAAAP